MVKRSRSRKAVRKGKKTRRAMSGGGEPTAHDVKMIKDYLDAGDGHGKDDAIHMVNRWLPPGRKLSAAFYNNSKDRQIQTVEERYPRLF